MAAQKGKQYSTIRYWRYVFTPIFLLGLFLGLFLLFTVPDTQTLSYEALSNQVAKVFAPMAPSAPPSDIPSI
jgi:predicted MFS family arabinose efflux permease